jgi:hypothetical protein
LIEIFGYLDIKTQKSFNEVFNKYTNMFEYIYELKTKEEMKQEDLLLFKNLRSLDCSRCKEIKDVNQLTNLTSLNCSDCQNIMDLERCVF